MMRHSACRRALIEGELDPEVASHLETCDRCHSFARDLGQVAEYAQAMAPGPTPPGLAERVIARVTGTPPSTETDEVDDAVIDPRRGTDTAWPGTQRKPLLATMAVAAVMLLLVGALATVARLGGNEPPAASPEHPEEIDALLAAAEHTLSAGTARVRLSGTARATVRPPRDLALPNLEFARTPPAFDPPAFDPPPPPDFSQMPPEQAEEALRAYEQQVDEMRRQYDAFVEETRRQYEQFRRDTSQVFADRAIPDEFSVELTISGTGAVRFSDTMRIDGEIQIQAAAETSLTGTYEFAVAVDGLTTVVRSPDGSWVEVPAPVGPLTPILADADGVASLLTGAKGTVDDRGRENLDGFRVRHYRFDVDSEVFGNGTARANGSVDVWIGVDDGVVHKLVASSSAHHQDPSGFESRMDSSMTLELFDFGTDVSVAIPEADATSSAPLGPAALLAPYEATMVASLYYEPPAPRSFGAGVNIEIGFDVPPPSP